MQAVFSCIDGRAMTGRLEQIKSVSGAVLRRFDLRISTGIALLRARSLSKERIESLPINKILVLCYGNIYRSPLAAACLRQATHSLRDIQIRSAGFHPRAGRRTPETFISDVRLRTGLDLSTHASSLATASDMDWADAIVVMDRHNWHALAKLQPRATLKAIWLGAFLPGGRAEISDPYGLSNSETLRIVDTVVEATAAMALRIHQRL